MIADVLRQGPVSPSVHGIIEYVAAVVLLAAPFVLGSDDGAATAASIIIGLVILVLTATSDLPTGLSRAVSAGVHVTADIVIALALIVAPFLLAFRDQEPGMTGLFIVLGVVHLLVTIATRFPGGRGSG